MVQPNRLPILIMGLALIFGKPLHARLASVQRGLPQSFRPRVATPAQVWDDLYDQVDEVPVAPAYVLSSDVDSKQRPQRPRGLWRAAVKAPEAGKRRLYETLRKWKEAFKEMRDMTRWKRWTQVRDDLWMYGMGWNEILRKWYERYEEMRDMRRWKRMVNIDYSRFKG